ncbi:MAG: PKD domain-containing protein [Chitinophagaceae bacterium]
MTLCKLTAQSGAAFEFIQNKGQWEKEVKFKGEFPTGAFFLEQKGFSVLQYSGDDLWALHQLRHSGNIPAGNTSSKKGATKVNGHTVVDNTGGGSGGSNSNSFIVHSHMYRVTFDGASDNASILPDKVVPSYNNYIIGNDPSKWASHVPLFQAVTYKNIYPNIDLRYYSEGGRLKYDIIVNPGGDVNQIAMKYEGADKLSVKSGELVIKTSIGEFKELAPYSYQYDKAAGKQEITASYVITNNTVRFRVANYSKSSTLIIDPTLVFCSFTGSTAENYGFTATPGPGGTFFSGSIVFGPGFRTSPGAFQENFQGGNGDQHKDIGILKFSADGSQRLYATYLGSSNGNDYPHSIISDGAGNLVVMGRTYGSNYPGSVIEKSTGSAKGCDIVVTRLLADGSNYSGSLRIGGSGPDGNNVSDLQEGDRYQANSILRFYGDDSRSEVTLDASGNIYVAAQTRSTDFPIRGGFQPNPGSTDGNQDGVVLKINPACTDMIWSSYIGGSANDGAFVISVNPLTNDVFVGGATESSAASFPGNTTGAYQTGPQGGSDGYVAQISNDGSTLIKKTYLGTNAYDAVYGIKFDRFGIPYIMGTTQGAWPVLNAAYSVANSSQFVAKLKTDLSGFIYSTVFGSGSRKPNISPVAFLVDRCENVYISGWGGWLNGSEDPFDMAGPVGMGSTPDAIKPEARSDNKDFYFIVIRKDAASRLYATFFGQTGGEGEHVDGGTSRYDEEGVIYQAICANCFGSRAGTISSPFPTTPGVWAETNGTGDRGCNLAAVKIAFNFAGVGTGVKSFVGGVADTLGCVPFTVEFRDTIHNAKTYIWDFGDGSPEITTTEFVQSHTYNNVGNFRVRLIAIDSTTCNISDTSYTTIRVRNDPATIDFDFVKLDPCESLSYRFDNLSVPAPGKAFNDTSFTWDFGDGIRVRSGITAITHAYAAAGTYNIKLILTDTSFCNAPDSVTKRLSVAANVDARFETPAMGCVPYDAVFKNTSLGGATFEWTFGDGGTSTDIDPVHRYNNVGTYTIKLIVRDPNTCNKIDSTEFTITVNPNPTAGFSVSPVPPQANKPAVFTNLSTGGVQYKWLFGDGDSTIKTTMDTVMHQYNATGTYNACLITTNQFGCSDTTCNNVEAVVNPLMDVPNAFTPGRFGKNSTIRVEGFGIAKMTWRIYNRFGQKVFETADRKMGWDGTFNGKQLPMEVYTYTLDVEFTDGTKTRKTGDITLIR